MVKARRVTKLSMDDQSLIAHKLAIGVADGSAVWTDRVNGHTRERRWSLDGELLQIPLWMDRAAMLSYNWAARQIPQPTGSLDSEQVVKFLRRVEPEMLVWCLARHAVLKKNGIDPQEHEASLK